MSNYRQIYYLLCEYLLYQDTKCDNDYRYKLDQLTKDINSRYPDRIINPYELEHLHQLQIQHDARKQIYQDIWSLLRLLDDDDC